MKTRIFVAYGFDKDRDKWIPDLVLPLIDALDAEAVTGEELEGEIITEGVRDKINESDALIGFLMRRGIPNAQGVYETHNWVQQELGVAVGRRLQYVLEVRERGISEQGGITHDRMRIWYEEGFRDQCLVQLARVISRWSRGVTVTLAVRPEEVVKEISPYLRPPRVECFSIVKEDGRDRKESPADIYLGPAGPQVTVRGIPPRALVSIRVKTPRSSWSSGFINVDSLEVILEQEG